MKHPHTNKMRTNTVSTSQDRLIIDALDLIFNQNRTSGKALQTILCQAGVVNKTELATTVRDITRHWRLLQAAGTTGAEITAPQPFPQPGDPAQLLLSYRQWQSPHPQAYSHPLARLHALQEVRAVRESVPDWLDIFGEQELGTAWEAALQAQNTEPPVCLRTNTLKTDRERLQASLRSEEIPCSVVAYAPEAVCLAHHVNVFELPGFKQGWFEMQDAGSQAVSRLLDPAPGMRVIDACAGHGGKTLHLAALMQNKGKIIALDTKEEKFTELAHRAKRAGAQIIETRPVQSTKTIKRLKDQADRLLLDVPCSGSGVWRRNPEGKWRLSPVELERLLKIQQEILFTYSQMVKPGGRMVYATCSLFPSEGEKQIAQFLAERGKIFKLLQEKRFSPAQNGSDGFYMALLAKQAG